MPESGSASAHRVIWGTAVAAAMAWNGTITSGTGAPRPGPLTEGGTPMITTASARTMDSTETDDTLGFRIYDQGYAGDNIREASVYFTAAFLAGPAVVGAYVIGKTVAAIK
jgi:hypothetical protein